MKSQKNTAILLIFFLLNCISIHAINLDSVSEGKRNELLLSMAKEVVLRYGPDYYREDPKPVIKRGYGNDFVVIFPPKPEEKFEWTDAASVAFDNKSGLPTSVLFGSGIGKIFTDEYKSFLEQKYFGNKKSNSVNVKKDYNDEKISPIKYRTVEPNRVIKTVPYSEDTIDKPSLIQKRTDNTNLRMVYKGYYIMGKDTIKTYKVEADTIR